MYYYNTNKPHSIVFIHAYDICKSRSSRYSAVTFQNKTFICSQCTRNYISMLIKFNNQITDVNQTLPMRMLLWCNQHHLFAIQCSSSCNPSRCKLVLTGARQQFTDIAAVWVALPPLPCGQRSRWSRWHSEQKIRGNKSFKL